MVWMWRRRRMPVPVWSSGVHRTSSTGMMMRLSERGRRVQRGGGRRRSGRAGFWFLIDRRRLLPPHLCSLLIDFCFYLRTNGRSVFSQSLRGFISRLFVTDIVPVPVNIVLHAALSGQKPSRGVHGSDFVDDRRCDQSLLALEPSRQVNTFPFFDKAAELFVSLVRVDVSTSAAQHVVGVRCINAVSAGGGGCGVAVFGVVFIGGRHLMYRC